MLRAADGGRDRACRQRGRPAASRSSSCQGGVDTALHPLVPYDGIGRDVRNGLNFTERGFGVRGAIGVSDRGHTAASQLRPETSTGSTCSATLGVRWFHTGGIFAGAVGRQPRSGRGGRMAAARRHGTVVSYDLNYRPSLWDRSAESSGARRSTGGSPGIVDVIIGNEEDFTACLGCRSKGADRRTSPSSTPRRSAR